MKRIFATATITFSDGSAVHWRSLGKHERLYSIAVKYAVQVRVERGPQSIDEFFETWDKPSIHTAEHFLKTSIKDAHNSESHQ